MTELKIPRENANDDTVLITSIEIKDGQFIKIDDLVFTFETSKASIEFNAPTEGYIYLKNLSVGQQIYVDTVIGKIHAQKKDDEIKDLSDTPKKNPTLINNSDNSNISNVAKDLLNSGKIPVKNSKWLTSKNFIDNENTFEKNTAVKSRLPFKDNKLPKIQHKLKGINSRKIHEINALEISSPHLNSTIGINIDIQGRRVTNEFFNNSILDLLIYETSLLLKTSFKDLNAAFLNHENIIYFEDVIPGIAMDDKNNLSVIAMSDTKNLFDLGKQIIDAVIRFDDKKLTAKDTRETTFTITDLSGLDVNYVLPLINGFQTFILSVCKSKYGYQLYGTFDHRVTEGKRFSDFLSELKRRVELFENNHDVFQKIKKECYYCTKSLNEEQSLGSRGFLKIDDGESEKLICRNCYEGW